MFIYVERDVILHAKGVKGFLRIGFCADTSQSIKYWKNVLQTNKTHFLKLIMFTE